MRSKSFIALLACWASSPVLAGAAAAQNVDQQALFRHIHESFNTPVDMKFALKDLKPAAIPGFLVGRLELGDAPPQVQVIHISKDGRYYFLTPAFKMGPSQVPGMRAPAVEPDQPPPPPVYVSADGQFMLFASPMDLSVNPDADNMKKIGLKGPSWGSPKAAVTLVEYSDLQCPHCKHAHETLEKELPAAYKDKVRWLIKSYPLANIHAWAYSGAEAVACAWMIKPDSARDVESAFFRDQDSITKDMVRGKALEYAAKAGIDSARFSACLDKEESKPLVEADLAEGNALGVTGTPAIFINGRRVRSNSFPEMKAIIDEMLRANHPAR